MELTLDDLMTMSQTVYGEMQRETFRAMQLCATTILNRTRLQLGGRDLLEVCYKTTNYACWDAGRQGLIRLPLKDARLSQAVRASLAAYEDYSHIDDNSAFYHLTHYVKDNTPAQELPRWAIGRKPRMSMAGYSWYAIGAAPNVQAIA